MRGRINSSQLERWFGSEWIEQTAKNMHGWYGTPLPILSTGGHVKVDSDGYFSGKLKCGRFCSLRDYIEDRGKLLYKQFRKMSHRQLESVQMAGLAGLSDLVDSFKSSRQVITFNKQAATGAASASTSLFRVGNNPLAGGIAASVPGGSVFTSASGGALPLVAPTSGENMYLSGGFFQKTIATSNYPVLLYDKIFGTSIAMSSSSAQAVTGEPTRYQNYSSTAEDSIVNNFLYIEVTSTLSNTAHNWNNCTYINERGNSATLPTLTGTVSLAGTRLDLPLNYWFAPLANGDRGIKALTSAECSSASLTGGIEFAIGHPIGWIPYVLTNQVVLDGLIGGFQLARIFDDACLTFICANIPNTSPAVAGYINIITR